MAGPRDGFVSAEFVPPAGARAVRPSAFAGLFYPDDPDRCRALAQSYLRPGPAAAGQAWCGALVPHAGWVYSGAVAGEAIATVAGTRRPDVVVVFGAIHTRPGGRLGVLDSHASWALPGADAPVATGLRDALASHVDVFAVDDRFHLREHAVEVELPLVELAWPGVAVVAVEVPVADEAVRIGQETARAVGAAGARAVFLASSDLTHYGPDYGFEPAGPGEAGFAWAKDNDRRLLDRVVARDAEAIVPEVRRGHNACGAGAIAAMLSACRELGASRAEVLRHTNSAEVAMTFQARPSDNAVGYAAVVVG